MGMCIFCFSRVFIRVLKILLKFWSLNARHAKSFANSGSDGGVPMTTPIRQGGVCSVLVAIPNGRKRGKQAFYFDESIKLQGPAFFSSKGTMNASHAEMVASVANSSRMKGSVWRRLILLLFTTLRKGCGYSDQ